MRHVRGSVGKNPDRRIRPTNQILYRLSKNPSSLRLFGEHFLVQMAPLTSWPPSLQLILRARSPQPEVLSQESSARNLQPGNLNQESSARSPQAGVLSQESSANSLQSICLGSALESLFLLILLVPRFPDRARARPRLGRAGPEWATTE